MLDNIGDVDNYDSEWEYEEEDVPNLRISSDHDPILGTSEITPDVIGADTTENICEPQNKEGR